MASTVITGSAGYLTRSATEQLFLIRVLQTTKVYICLPQLVILPLGTGNRSRWHLVRCKLTLSALPYLSDSPSSSTKATGHRTDVTFLGIPFINRQYFWLANEADLEYLYDDFVKAAKVIKCRLHPDRGGNTESFARFSKHCSMVVNAFRKHGIDQRDTINTFTRTRRPNLSRKS